MGKLRANSEIISDKSKNPVTTSTYIKHGNQWLDDAVNNAIGTAASKADKTYVDSELTKKANKSDTDAALSSKADKSELSTKADKSALEATNASVSANASNIQGLSTESAALSARMDTFTKLSEGSTTGDAELADGRVGADGKTYDNIGGAIRGQVTDLKSEISEIAESIGNTSVCVEYEAGSIDKYGNSLNSYFDIRIRSAYIKSGKFDKIVAPEGYSFNTFLYDNSKVFIKSIGFSSEVNVNNYGYVRLVVKKDSDEKIIAAEGLNINYFALSDTSKKAESSTVRIVSDTGLKNRDNADIGLDGLLNVPINNKARKALLNCLKNAAYVNPEGLKYFSVLEKELSNTLGYKLGSTINSSGIEVYSTFHTVTDYVIVNSIDVTATISGKRCVFGAYEYDNQKNIIGMAEVVEQSLGTTTFKLSDAASFIRLVIDADNTESTAPVPNMFDTSYVDINGERYHLKQRRCNALMYKLGTTEDYSGVESASQHSITEMLPVDSRDIEIKIDSRFNVPSIRCFTADREFNGVGSKVLHENGKSTFKVNSGTAYIKVLVDASMNATTAPKYKEFDNAAISINGIRYYLKQEYFSVVYYALATDSSGASSISSTTGYIPFNGYTAEVALDGYFINAMICYNADKELIGTASRTVYNSGSSRFVSIDQNTRYARFAIIVIDNEKEVSPTFKQFDNKKLTVNNTAYYLKQNSYNMLAYKNKTSVNNFAEEFDSGHSLTDFVPISDVNVNTFISNNYFIAGIRTYDANKKPYGSGSNVERVEGQSTFTVSSGTRYVRFLIGRSINGSLLPNDKQYDGTRFVVNGTGYYLKQINYILIGYKLGITVDESGVESESNHSVTDFISVDSSELGMSINDGHYITGVRTYDDEMRPFGTATKEHYEAGSSMFTLSSGVKFIRILIDNSENGKTSPNDNEYHTDVIKINEVNYSLRQK